MTFTIFKSMSFIFIAFAAMEVLEASPTFTDNSTDETAHRDSAIEYQTKGEQNEDETTLACSTTGCALPERPCCSNMHCNEATRLCQNIGKSDTLACSTTGCALPERPCCSNMHCNEAIRLCQNIGTTADES